MSLLAFLAVCGVGTMACLLARPFARIGRLAGLAGLLAAFVAALFIGPTTRLAVGDVTLSGTGYAGLFLACAAGSGLVLCVVALASGWSDALAPAALASFAGLAVAFTAAEPGVALPAAAAATTAGALVFVGVNPKRPEDDGRLAEIRIIGLLATALLLAAVALLRPVWNGASDTSVFVLAFLGLALALAVRSGAVPFHGPAARLGRSATAMAPALLLIWLPAGLGILVLSWSATTFTIQSDWLSAGLAILQTAAVATIVLGGLAALVRGRLDEIVAYSIVSDAGFLLLALAARTDAAVSPARLWLLAFVAAKTGFVAWSAAVGLAYGTTDIDRLKGWLRRTPMLGLALAAIAVATLGWPGTAVYQARATLVQLALPAQLQLLFGAAVVLSVAYYGRLLVVGLRSPAEEVSAARSELPRWSAEPPRAKGQAPGKEGDAGDSVRSPAEGPVVQETATAVDATGFDTGGGAVTTKTKRRGARAAAAAAAASASVTQLELATIAATPTVVASSPPRDGPSLGRRLAGIWRLNRTVEVSLVVLGGTALALALAFGGLGASAASRSGIPLDATTHASPAPTLPPTPAPTSTPVATLGPSPAISPSGAAGASGSAGASVTPSS